MNAAHSFFRGFISCLLLLWLAGALSAADDFAPPTEVASPEPDAGLDRFHPETAERLREAFDLEKIVFIKRPTFQSSHYYTDFIDGTRFFGTDLCLLDLKTGHVDSILPEKMKKGLINRIDLSYDAQRIVFDWKADQQSGFHLWEIGIDGTDCRRLTFPPADEKEISRKYHLFEEKPWHWIRYPFKYPIDFGVYGHWNDDLHPCCLPDGGIAFVSTRCRYGILCDGPDVLTTTVLHRIDADGDHLEMLSNSSVSEANPTMTDDGRILYTRWEYIDKGASCVKCLWSMRVDGSASAEVYGNDLAMPPSIVHARQIPGEANLFVATAAPHCPQTGVGGLIRIDTTKDTRTEAAMENLTPETSIEYEGWFDHPWTEEEEDKERKRWLRATGPHFADPYPLDAGTLMMTCQRSRDEMWLDPDGYDLCVYFGPGEYEPLFEAGGTSCWVPIPVRPREVPSIQAMPENPLLAEREIAGHPVAQCIVTDVYHGLEGVESGTVKYIRINEQVPRPWAARRTWEDVYVDNYDQQHAAVGATHLGLKAQWGIVPVEEDGSANFYVPANRNIFFQVLDENFQELQRERTFVNYMPGEVRSCIGCHERPGDAPGGVLRTSPLAMRRLPSSPGPQPGEETGRRCLDFQADIQPILDEHCIECHNAEGEEHEGKATDLDLRGIPTRIFSISYENLIGQKCSRDDSYEVENRDLVGPLIREIRPKVGNAEYLAPKTLGSTQARLVTILREGHYDCRLSEEEMVRLTTWIDSNCQYYGTYWGRKNVKFRDHPNFRPEVTFAETIATEAPLPDDQR
jgi:hypothetical protein